MVPDQTGRTCVVTGANSGIGLETARLLAARGANVVLACRDPHRAEAACADIVSGADQATVDVGRLDLADLESVAAFAEWFLGRYEGPDVLVNNAGVMFPPPSTTVQGFELQFGVNFLAHFALTGALLPAMRRRPGSRVVTVSSLMHHAGRLRLDDIRLRGPYRAGREYCRSKLADLSFSGELARRLATASAGTYSLAAHPGVTRTRLQRHSGTARLLVSVYSMKAAKGCLPSVRAATDPAARNGDYFGPRGLAEARGYPSRARRSRRAKNHDDARALWELAVDVTGVDPGLPPARQDTQDA